MIGLEQVFHALCLLLVCAGIFYACRYITRVSRVLGAIVWIGIVLRLVAGLGLLGASYLDVAPLRGLHTGDGFWSIAPDARVYFELARKAADSNALSIAPGSPSPSFIFSLGVWFALLGAHQITVVLFNIVCYVVACLAIAVGLRHKPEETLLPGRGWTLGGTLIITSLTFSPVLLLTTTQTLKDPFFGMLIVVGCVGALTTLNWLARGATDRMAGLLGGLLTVMVSVCGAAGTRAYYPLFMWGAYAIAVGVVVALLPRPQRLTAVAVGITVLGLIWLSFRVGAGPYYDDYEALLRSSLSLPPAAGHAAAPSHGLGDIGETVIHFRNGFVRSAGRTNLAHGFSSTGVFNMLGDLGLGLSAMFIPMGLLQALSIVDFDGSSRSFLVVIADLDTLFLDVMLIAVAVLLAKNRRILKQNPVGTVFLVVLACMVGGLLAYVVTNFGTLFRLRLLAIVPAWLLPLAVSHFDPAHGLDQVETFVPLPETVNERV